MPTAYTVPMCTECTVYKNKWRHTHIDRGRYLGSNWHSWHSYIAATFLHYIYTYKYCTYIHTCIEHVHTYSQGTYVYIKYIYIFIYRYIIYYNICVFLPIHMHMRTRIDRTHLHIIDLYQKSYIPYKPISYKHYTSYHSCSFSFIHMNLNFRPVFCICMYMNTKIHKYKTI